MIDWLQTHLGMNPELQTKLLATVATIVGLWLLRRVVLGVVYRRVQDRVQIGPHAGDVIDLGLFQFTLNEIGAWVQADQSSGRIIHVPNGKVFTDPVANYNKGFRYIWNEVPVVVTFESDWKKAKQI